MADDFDAIRQLQGRAKASAAAGLPFRETVELSDGGIYGETITVGPPLGVIPKPEWVAAVTDSLPDE